MRIALAIFAAATLSACTTTGLGTTPTDVMRYHLGEPVERGTVVVQPAAGGDGLADQPFAGAVARELGTIGYNPAAPGGTVQFIALVDVRRTAQEGRRRSPFSIGIGGGGFSGGRGGGVGLGGGIGIPIGGGRSRLVSTELSVTIKRRLDQSPVWEGHARTIEGRDALESATAEKLARALFTGFPGESGRTITVR
jgi:hypothetical protein